MVMMVREKESEGQGERDGPRRRGLLSRSGLFDLRRSLITDTFSSHCWCNRRDQAHYVVKRAQAGRTGCRK